MKKCHEVESKSWPNYDKISLSFLVSWSYVLEIITWYLSTFGRSCVKKICRFHGDLQLSCWKFILNHPASWWKYGSKLWKNMKFPTLRKISMFRNFDLSKWNLDFLISWWISLIFWHVWWIMIFGTWIWPKSQSLTFQYTVDFWSVDCKIHMSIQWTCNVLNHVIRLKWCNWNL